MQSKAELYFLRVTSVPDRSDPSKPSMFLSEFFEPVSRCSIYFCGEKASLLIHALAKKLAVDKRELTPMCLCSCVVEWSFQMRSKSWKPRLISIDA